MQYKSISHKNINQNFLKEYLYSRGVFDTENFLHPTEKNLEDKNRKKKQQETVARKKERQKQEALLQIRKKFGKNSILKGMNLEEGATTRERNNQIGGHKA